MRVEGGCFRLDFGEIIDIDRLVLHVPDEYSLQPILRDEGNYAEVSTDLKTWDRLTFLAGKLLSIDIPAPVRYIRFRFIANSMANGLSNTSREYKIGAD